MALLVGAGALVLAAVVFVAQLLARREQRRELRELVLVLEELRAGRSRRRLEVHPRSSLAVLGDVVNRLVQDIHARSLEWNRTREQLEAFLEGMGQLAIVHVDADWDIRALGGAARELLGWSEQELFARPVEELFVPEAWGELLPKLARRSLREQAIRTRTALRRRDGSSFEAELTVQPARSGTGEVTGYVLLVRDISAQVQLERERDSARARYAGLLEALPAGVLVVRDGEVAYANPPGAQLLGVGGAEPLRGLRLRDRVAVRDLLVVQEALQACAAQGRPASAVCTLLGSRGEPAAHVRFECRPLSGEEGAAVLVFVVDETPLRAAEATAVRLQGRLQALVDALPDAVAWFEVDGAGALRLRMANRALAQLLGTGRATLEQDAPERLAARLAEAGAEVPARWLQAPPAERREAIFEQAASGRPKSFQAAWLPAGPLAPGTGGALLLLHDCTHALWLERERQAEIERLRRERAELEQAHERLEQERAELERRCAQLERLREELRQLDRMKSDLLANVSHELQTPLVSIKGYTEMILKERLGPINEEQRKGLSLALRNIDRLISMIDNLLLVSRLESEIGELKRTVFALRPLVEEALELLAEAIAAKRLSAEVDFEDPEIRVAGDREKLLQVFVNLLSNAVKFNREGGRIEIRAQPIEAHWVEVRVRDTGVGIPQEALERIFERYYRASEGGQAGTGIGLAIVRDIVRLHGGSIRAESEPGQGATFILTLPLEADGRGSGSEAGGDPQAGEQAPRSAHDRAGSPPQEPPPGRGDPEAQRPRPRFRVIRRHPS